MWSSNVTFSFFCQIILQGTIYIITELEFEILSVRVTIVKIRRTAGWFKNKDEDVVHIFVIQMFDEINFNVSN